MSPLSVSNTHTMDPDRSIENCVQEFCYGYPATTGTCPEMGLDPKNCCGSSDPATCLNTWVHGSSGSTSGSSSESGSDNPCASVVEVIYTCSTASPSLFPSGSIYTTGPIATALASCLCYNSNGSYDASAFDAYASECVTSGSAAHPTYYPFAKRLDGFCSNIAGPASTTATLTSAHAETVVTGVMTAILGATKSSVTGTSPVSTTSSSSSGQSVSQESFCLVSVTDKHNPDEFGVFKCKSTRSRFNHSY